jgi:GAF domain-containing protein
MSPEASTIAGDQSREGLRRELAEAREQQAATAGILAAISSSPADLGRVFAEIAANAARLCDAYDAIIGQLDSDTLRLVAHHGPIPTTAPVGQATLPLTRGSSLARAVLDRQTIHVVDLQAEKGEYPEGSDLAHRHGIRTVLHQPLMRSGKAIGVISIRRADVRPFTDRQIELLKTFADQAVIAIENTRLFEEVQTRTKQLQEALDYQTATSEVLNVISRAPTELQPVLDAIVQIAGRLCEADYALIFKLEGNKYHLIAASNAEAAFVKHLARTSYDADSGSLTGRVATEATTIHIPDVLDDPEYARPELQQLGKYRSVLGVPLMRHGRPVGTINLSRTIVKPFTDKQIELVTIFADQAVIAIENTRLFEEVQARTRELTDALEQQTATSEVLKIISSSPGDLQPVFNAMLENATRMCDAYFGILYRFANGAFQAVTLRGAPPAFAEFQQREPIRPGPASGLGRILSTRHPVHITDTMAEQRYLDGDPYAVTAAKLSGSRTIVFVPMLKDDEVVGAIAIYRREVNPFTDKQIELVSNFAKQAVIAIENTRLLNELRESLQQQTATADVLKVISRATFDLPRVLDTLVESAASLCDSDDTAIIQRDGEVLRVVSHRVHIPSIGQQDTFLLTRGGPVGRAILDRQTIHLADAQSETDEYPVGREFARRLGFRTILAVPLVGGGEAVGAITLRRSEVRPFTDRQIELLQTFADQAVIAIENARLFEEVQARNRDLTALGEVGRAVSSTLDLKVVLKTVVERAVELSGTDAGSIFYYRSEIGRFELGETVGLDEETVSSLRKLDIAAGQTGLGEAIARRVPLQIPDVVKRPSNRLRDAALEAGLHAALIVPLLGSEGALGALVLQRRRTGEFTPSVVSLMQSFADQSAIALENARLFEEIAQKSRELEIASQHKSQFVANMSHELRTPLAAILGYAELIQEGFYEPQGPKSLDALTRIRSNGKHLLGLINTVLDIAKIESGQFTLNMAEYAIESVVETVRVATESLAQSKKLVLKTDVAKSLPIGLGDEQRLTQVLLNLVGARHGEGGQRSLRRQRGGHGTRDPRAGADPHIRSVPPSRQLADQGRRWHWSRARHRQADR